MRFRPEAPISPTDTPVPTFVTPETRQMEQDILVLVNQHRTTSLKPAVTADKTCAAEARAHSVDMAAGHVPFGNDGFFERAARIGAATGNVARAEILAVGMNTADEVVQGFLKMTDSTGVSWIYGPYSLAGWVPPDPKVE